MFDNLPPQRELPPAVRAMARQRLGAALNGRPARPARMVLATAGVAAAVAITAIGVPLLTPSAPDGEPVAAQPSAPPSASPADDPLAQVQDSLAAQLHVRDGALAEEAGRCQADGWQPLFTAGTGGVTVIALQSGDQRRFCELTPATVTLSAPAGLPADGARITHLSATGTVAGVVGAGTEQVRARDPKLLEGDPGQGEWSVVRDGVFVLPNTLTAGPSPVTLFVGDTEITTALPAVVPPRTDRPQPEHAGLPACAARDSAPPLIDASAWEPAAAVTLTAAETVQNARYAGLLATCLVIKKEGSPDTVRLFVTDEHATDTFLRPPANPFLITQAFFYNFTAQGSTTMAIAALVTDERVAKVTLDGLAAPITATVDHGTLLLPGVTGQGPLQLTLTLTGSDGTTLGTLPISL